jgi:signal transduction histidine kinase
MRRSRLTADAVAGLTWVAAAAVVALHLADHGRGGDLTSWWLANVLTAVFIATPGWLIASRRRGNVIGWLLLVAGAAQSLTGLGREYATVGLTRPGSVPAPVQVLSVAESLWQVTAVALVLVLLLFPTGRPLTHRWRSVVPALLVCSVVLAVVSALSPGALSLDGHVTVTNPLGVESRALDLLGTAATFGLLAVGLLACAGVVLRYRRSHGVERLQMKWFVTAGLLAAAELMAELVVPAQVSIALSPVVTGLFAAAIAAAVLRYRLYDIDWVINRSLVYLALTACLVGGYLFVVTVLGTELGRRVPFTVSLFAAAIVAIALAPLRDRLRAGVDRLMYGERADPYSVLVRLSGRLGASTVPDETLGELCRTVAEALRLPYVAVTVGEEDRLLASYGTAVDAPTRVPMTHQAGRIGSLLVAPRPGDDLAHPADRRLLADVAAHAAVSVYAAHVSEDLRRSRQQVIEAREEERRRLRRDLHDGLGPTLAAVRMGADTARALLRTDPDEADRVLSALRTDAADAVADIRRLVHDLRPPALDELGLVPAIREQAARLGQGGCVIRVEAPDRLPDLAAAVEVATYRIVTEALTNVVRHSGASTCLVRLTVDEMLEVDIADDGNGVTGVANGGVGLASMRERTAELGGRWRLEAVAPHGTLVAFAMPTGAPR